MRGPHELTLNALLAICTPLTPSPQISMSPCHYPRTQAPRHAWMETMHLPHQGLFLCMCCLFYPREDPKGMRLPLQFFFSSEQRTVYHLSVHWEKNSICVLDQRKTSPTAPQRELSTHPGSSFPGSKEKPGTSHPHTLPPPFSPCVPAHGLLHGSM